MSRSSSFNMGAGARFGSVSRSGIPACPAAATPANASGKEVPVASSACPVSVLKAFWLIAVDVVYRLVPHRR